MAQKKYKWITIERVPNGEYYISNNKSNELIGVISFYERWNQWIVEFDDRAVFSASCLTDIAEFIRGLK